MNFTSRLSQGSVDARPILATPEHFHISTAKPKSRSPSPHCHGYLVSLPLGSAHLLCAFSSEAFCKRSVDSLY